MSLYERTTRQWLAGKPACSGGQCPQVQRQLRQRRVPVTRLGLAVQARAGVPGRVAAVHEPAPVGQVGQQDPGALAQGAAQVGHAGVH